MFLEFLISTTMPGNGEPLLSLVLTMSVPVSAARATPPAPRAIMSESAATARLVFTMTPSGLDMDPRARNALGWFFTVPPRTNQFPYGASIYLGPEWSQRGHANTYGLALHRLR